MAHRTTDMFATTAKQDGKVLSVTSKGIVVEFVDGERKGISLGVVHGKAEGSVYPHTIITPLSAGQTFSKGDVLAYNTGFFEVDMLNPKQVVWKTSFNAKTVLWETNQTDEDSAFISPKIAEKMKAKTTKVRSFVIDFKQGVHKAVKPGMDVTPEDVLFILEDSITGDTGTYDEKSIESLKKFANMAPKAKVYGHIDKVEVYYHGSKEDMTPSLRTLVNQSDKDISNTYKSIGRDISNGQVTNEYRVEGNPLQLDTAEIKIYVTVHNGTGLGDKLVVANQLKGTISEVMDYTMTTESGEEIDIGFGYRSVGARIVASTDLIGTTTTLLKVIGKKAVEIYNK